MSTENEDLSSRIMAFLRDHAGIAADFDPDYDDPADCYSSPDAAELHVAADAIRDGRPLRRVPWSSWGSGGYRPYSDPEARKTHDDLIAEITAYANQMEPPKPRG